MILRHSVPVGKSCLQGVSFLLILLVSCCCIGVQAIGVDYGTVANDLPTPAEVVLLLKSTSIQKVKIYAAPSDILTAFANSGFDIVVGVTNQEIAGLAASASAAQQWVSTNVAAYYPATNIVIIVVGNEVLTSSPNDTNNLVPAMQNLQTGLVNLGLNANIKVTTPHSYGVLGTSFPPSDGAFRSDLAGPVFTPLLAFLSQTGAPFMINAYPYFAYSEDPKISIAYALFEPNAGVLDSAVNLTYQNLFDAQVDATYAAMSKLGHEDITVTISETGWPSLGDADEVGVSLADAQTYNSNLLKHINSNAGTPLKPGTTIDTYIFSLFNENLKPGPTSERNFGLFLPDQTSVYNVGIITGNVSSTPPAPVVSTPSPPPPTTTPAPVSSPSPPPPTTAPAPVSPPTPPAPASISSPPPPLLASPPPGVTASPPPPPYPVPQNPPSGGGTPVPVPVTPSPEPAAASPPPSTPPPTSIIPPPSPVATSPPPPSFFNPPPGVASTPPPPVASSPAPIAGTPPFLPSSPPPPVALSPSSSPPAVPTTPPPAAAASPPPVVQSSPPPPVVAPGPASPLPPPAPAAPQGPSVAPPGTPPAPPGTPSGPNTWCVAKPGSAISDLLNALNYACGNGGANCTPIQTGQPCFDPDTLFSHASYAFSSYYAQNGRNYWDCFFGNSSLITITNPSYASCTYP